LYGVFAGARPSARSNLSISRKYISGEACAVASRVGEKATKGYASASCDFAAPTDGP
jgi:hypothetical protein